MFSKLCIRTLAAGLGTAVALASTVAPALSQVRANAQVGGPPPGPAFLPTGQYVTALAAPGSRYEPIRTVLRPDANADANGAVTTALSPDGKTLLVLASGYNCCFSTTGGKPITTPYIDPITGAASSQTTGNFEWVFVYDVSGKVPQKTQQIQVPNAFDGLAWDPSGTKFYFSGGQDDRIYAYKASGATWVPDAPFAVLGHNGKDRTATPSYDGGILKFTPAGSSALVSALGLGFGAMTAGVAVSGDGSQLFAANLQDDSLSIVDNATSGRPVTHEVRLFRPGVGHPAVGEYPYWVTAHAAASGATDKVYVTSVRDGQVIVVGLASFATKVISVGGEPGKTLLSRDGSRLYVANPDLDEIEVVDTARDALLTRISVQRPAYRYRGAYPNSLALSPDGLTLYSTLANENAVAVIDLASQRVRGRIPTAWQPSSVSVSADGSQLYVVNTKHESTPTPTLKGGYTPPAFPNPESLDQYVYNTEKSGLETIPLPDANALAYLTRLVDTNNGFGVPHPLGTLAFLRGKIKHIIYVQKENRTYDQVLGDLSEGNGDPRLVEFPTPVTPNFHALALQFVDLDNWYMAGDVSGDGWNWSQQAVSNDYTNKKVPVSYAGGGFDFQWNGTNRYQNNNLPDFAHPATQTTERMTQLADPTGASNIQPGPKNIEATVGTDDDRPGQTGGYIWDSVLRAGLSYRHYGLYADETFYSSPSNPYEIPIVRNAFAAHAVQAAPLRPAIAPYFDKYFRGWDLNAPDEYRYEEWKREFDGYVKHRNLPAFETMLFMMDHFGSFSTNVAGLSNPNVQIASDDHALGQLVDAVSHSPYWSSTAIFVLEDDSQDGPDHVDAHRSIAYVISPWVRRGTVVHTAYNTTSMLATMEDLLGIDHLAMNDANADPMSDVFTTHANLAPYDVIIPGVLCAPPVDPNLVPACKDPRARKTGPVAPLHGAPWWSRHTKNLVFTAPDKNDALAFNQLLWQGQMGATPYPTTRSGEDLSQNRAALLASELGTNRTR